MKVFGAIALGLLLFAPMIVAVPEEKPDVPDFSIRCPGGRVIDLFARAGDACASVLDASGVVIGGECKQPGEDGEISAAADCALGCSVSVYPGDCTER